MKMNFAYNLILNYSILNPKLILKKWEYTRFIKLTNTLGNHLSEMDQPARAAAGPQQLLSVLSDDDPE